MDTPLNEGAACIAAGGPKGDDAFLGRNEHKNSANNDKDQQKTLPADSLDTGVLLVLRTLISPFKDDGEDGPTTFRRRRLAKRIRRGGDPTTIEPYEGAKNFEACGLDVSTFDKLFDGLDWLLREWAIAPVQGGKLGSANPRRMQKLIYDDYDRETKTVIPKTITDKPCIILPMDIDDLIPPPGVHGLLAVGLWARELLLPEFRNAKCIIQATGSYGFKRGAHIRLWFVLDRALTCAEKRCWLRALAKIDGVKFVDIGLYTANQLVFTSSPVFEDVNDDPLFDMPRLLVIDGEEFVRTPCAERLKPTVHDSYDYQAAMMRAVTAGGNENGLILGSMVAIDCAMPGGRHDRIMREAFTLAGFAVAGVINPDMALRGLIRAGTKIIPGEREIKPDEIIREWKHAMLKKKAEWNLEQRHSDPSSYDGED
jgi:hypothetical protein